MSAALFCRHRPAPAIDGSRHDAKLFDPIALYGDIAAERNAHEAAEERFKAGVPPRPVALTETFSDVLDHLTSTGHNTRPDGRPWPYFTPGDIERLRAAGPVTEVVWGEDGQSTSPVLNPRGEKRRLEILATHDAWQAKVQALADQVGLTAVEAEDDRLSAAVWSLREAIRGTRPVTITWLCAKARWVVTLTTGKRTTSRWSATSRRSARRRLETRRAGPPRRARRDSVSLRGAPTRRKSSHRRRRVP